MTIIQGGGAVYCKWTPWGLLAPDRQREMHVVHRRDFCADIEAAQQARDAAQVWQDVVSQEVGVGRAVAPANICLTLPPGKELQFVHPSRVAPRSCEE